VLGGSIHVTETLESRFIIKDESFFLSMSN
jgi:hypothetical protein